MGCVMTVECFWRSRDWVIVNFKTGWVHWHNGVFWKTCAYSNTRGIHFSGSDTICLQ
jgi:hypothetical protein